MAPNPRPPSHTASYDLSAADHLPAAEFTQMTAWVDRFLSGPATDLPRLPAAAMEILEASRRPNTRIEELANLLTRDAPLAARVLKLANSALYGGVTPLVELKTALVRLGVGTVRDVVVEAAMQMSVCRSDGFQPVLGQLRRHSSAVAWVSRFVARLTPMEAENAFLLGLLHDVGMNVALIGVARGMKQAGRVPVLTDAAWTAANTLHEGIGERLLATWKLPPSLVWVIGHHHQLHGPGPMHPSVAVLAIAENIASDLGWGLSPRVTLETDSVADLTAADHPTHDLVERALLELRLTPKHLAMVKADVQRVLVTLDGMLGDVDAHSH